MGLNPRITQYDDEGYPSNATGNPPLTFAGGIVKQGPGRLVKVIVTTVFAGAGGQLAFYDSPNGTATVNGVAAVPLLTIPVAGGVVGAMFTVDLPAFTGISAINTGGTLTGGAVTVGIS